MALPHARRTPPLRRAGLMVGAVALAMSLFVAACRATPTLEPTVAPSPTPTSTPDPQRAMDEAVFTISLDGRLMGVETLRLGEEAGSLLAFSELVHADAIGTVERRTVVLSELWNPLRYDLEVGALGARSTWVGERDGEVMDVLNNNLAWFGPVLTEGVAPAPDVMLEGTPSALPFALLALRDYGPQGLEGTQQVHTLDVLEDLPASRALTVTVDMDRQGAVIGTVAVEGHWEDASLPAFTMWVRSGSRALYSVEVPARHPGPWGGRYGEPLEEEPSGTIVIQRVGSPPELPTPTPAAGDADRSSVEFTSRDGTRLVGELITPRGNGPFPCVVLLGPGGIAPRWDPGDALARKGWAALTYDPRGLGESGGEFLRDRPALQAADAVAAVAMLQARPEIDPDRVVVLGIGAGGLAGALAVSAGGVAGEPGVAAAVLGSVPGPGPVFPDVALHGVTHALAPYYGWSADDMARYRALSVTRWQEWLFDEADEVTLLRRRVSLQPLHDLADLDLADVLAGTDVPVLVLQGMADPWIPEGSAEALAGRLVASGGRAEARVFEGLGHALGRGTDPETLLAPQVDGAIWAWLEATLAD